MTPNTVATGARSSFRLVNDWKAVRGRRGSPGVARWGRIRRDSGASKRNFPSPSNGGYRRKWRLLRYARLNVRAEMKSYNGFRGWIYIRQRMDLFNRGLKIPQVFESFDDRVLRGGSRGGSGRERGVESGRIMR